MGGQSYSTFAVKDGVGVFTGDCKIVPSLKAPGFCDAEAPKLKAVDGSEYNTVQITLKNKGDLVAFKSSWTGPRVPRDPDCHHPGCIFEQGIYKASFNITSAVTKPSGGDFTVVQIPYTVRTNQSFSLILGNKYAPAHPHPHPHPQPLPLPLPLPHVRRGRGWCGVHGLAHSISASGGCAQHSNVYMLTTLMTSCICAEHIKGLHQQVV